MQGILKLFRPRHIVNVVNNAGVRVQTYSGTSDNPPEPYLQIPLYPVNKPQPLEHRKARLVYQSRKRGMLENDLILSTFVKQHLHTMDEGQVLLYDHLINSPSNDWDLFYWITEKKPTPKEFDNEVMDMLKYHAKNTKKESLRQPNLHE